MNENGKIQSNDILEKVEEVKLLPIDGKVEVEVEAGGHSARLLIVSAQNGGNDVTRDQVFNELKAKGIVYGIDYVMINKIINQKLFDKMHTIAHCLPAKDGTDGTITFLYEKKVSGMPKEDNKGFVDYKDLGLIRNIEKGTVIAKITKETEGEAGINVKNEKINPKPGKPAKVTFYENVALTEDGLQLYASCSGNLVYKNERFSVETVVRIDGDIDISTGNIDFVGDVVIKGDVREGYSVTAGKTLTVYGGAFSAKLTAEDKIVVKKGAIGSAIISGNVVEIDFAENTSIDCFEELKAKNLISCNVFCRGNIYCNTGTGTIIGGSIIATKNLYASVIGAKSYLATNIVIGDNAIMMQEKDSLSKKLEEMRQEEEKLTKIVEFLSAKKAEYGKLPQDKNEILVSARKTILVHKHQVLQMQNRIGEIDEYLENKQDLFLECRKELYPGVRITINDAVIKIKELYQHCKLFIHEGQVQIAVL